MAKAQVKQAQKTRIQNQNEEMILDAALEVFAGLGFKGTTIDQIAAKCGLSKPNLLYYFPSKQELYRAVLERTLKTWLGPLRMLDPQGDPQEELSRYIEAKLQMSFDNPAASRLFANEILHGAPHIREFLKGPLSELVENKARIISGWSESGQISPVDPYHLIFAIWAVTQHYADFAVQIEALLGPRFDQGKARSSVLHILLRGIKN